MSGEKKQIDCAFRKGLQSMKPIELMVRDKAQSSPWCELKWTGHAPMSTAEAAVVVEILEAREFAGLGLSLARPRARSKTLSDKSARWLSQKAKLFFNACEESKWHEQTQS